MAKVKFPVWWKWLVVFLILSLIGGALQYAAHGILAAFIIMLIMFPGEDTENPRLFKVIPFLWILSILGGLFVLGIWIWGNADLKNNIVQINMFDVLGAVAVGPVLLYTFVKRQPVFKAVLITGFCVTIASTAYGLMGDLARGEVASKLGMFISEAIITGYLLFKFTPQTDLSEGTNG
jgi:hypothetical protein